MNKLKLNVFNDATFPYLT